MTTVHNLVIFCERQKKEIEKHNNPTMTSLRVRGPPARQLLQIVAAAKERPL